MLYFVYILVFIIVYMFIYLFTYLTVARLESILLVDKNK